MRRESKSRGTEQLTKLKCIAESDVWSRWAVRSAICCGREAAALKQARAAMSDEMKSLPRNWDMKYEKTDFTVGAVLRGSEFALSFVQIDYHAARPSKDEKTLSVPFKDTQIVSRVVMSREAFEHHLRAVLHLAQAAGVTISMQAADEAEIEEVEQQSG